MKNNYIVVRNISNTPVMFTDPTGEVLAFPLIALLAVAVVLLLSLTSCDTDKNSTTESSSSPTVSDEEDEFLSSKPKGQNKYGSYDEAVNGGVHRVYNEATANGFSPETYMVIFQYPGDDYYYTNGTSSGIADYCQMESGLPEGITIIATIHSHWNHSPEPFSKDEGLFQDGRIKVDNYVVDRGYLNNSFRVVLLPKGARQRTDWYDVTSSYIQ